MGLFSRKSEQELKTRARKLDELQTSLDMRKSALDSEQKKIQHERNLLDEAKAHFEAEKEAFYKAAKEEHERIESEKEELLRRRSEVLKLEAEAKYHFVEKQREAFKEVIENRMAELDARQHELEKAERDLAERLDKLYTKEADLARRELAVTEREQKADAGFADKAKALADEAERQYQANQEEAERLRKQGEALAEERRKLEVEKAKLSQRERDLMAAEQKRDADFAEEHIALDRELRDKRAKVESEIADYREKQFSALEQEIASWKAQRLREITEAADEERDRIWAEIAAKREEWEKEVEQTRKQLENERTEVEKRKGALLALQSELEARQEELEANERRLERQEQRLEQQWQRRHEKLNDEVALLLEEERKSIDTERQTLKKEIERLRESLRIQMEMVGAFDQLKKELGDRDPAEVIFELNSKADEIRRLREELVNRPTEEMREQYREMESEIGRLKARIQELEKELEENAELVAQANSLRRKNKELTEDNTMLSQKVSRLEAALYEAQAELERLRAAYERPAEVAARYREIEIPLFPLEKLTLPKQDETIDEIKWLKEVGKKCDDYGLHFHPRILKAFHTALKTAEWAPLTILAGVSGTGKSELPRLYAHFGGLMFYSVAVQPNWDSQECMLGFFNSIDNKFDAQPVLRYLAQSQKDWSEKTGEDEGYPGLKDAVCLVLLDEMNLAHPELYFAEFLSKLELRRGMKRSDVPVLEVKVGAGLPPYQLPLGRNVLWTGTMNQDETTKSLSDKVLDRSIIIYFPRPTKLKRRLQLKPLDEKNRSPLLHRVTWHLWLAQGSTFREEDIRPFKSFLEEMNKALAVAGRALGHRVWQSVEYYMQNYPDVREAQRLEDKDALFESLHTAFEDQLVQKVMPKLRGIDTRGKSKTECLDKIRAMLNEGVCGKSFNLTKDFDLACELGYGQFIWQSASYLEDNPTYQTDDLGKSEEVLTGEK